MDCKFVLFRLWYPLSTAVRGPKTLPTHLRCKTLQRLPISACTSSAPIPCSATSSPRPRETPPLHAGWDTLNNLALWCHAGRLLFPIWPLQHPPASLFFLKQAHRPAHMFTCVETHCQVCLLSIIWVILVISLIQSSVQDCAKHLSYSSFF